MTSEQRLHEILKNFLSYEYLDAALCGLIKYSEDDFKQRRETFLGSFREIWRETPAKDQNGLVRTFVAIIHSQKGPQWIEALHKILSDLVKEGLLSGRIVCETILTSDQLTFDNDVIWCHSFPVIHEIIYTMDYKSCRDVLGLILLKIKDIPQTTYISSAFKIEAILKVLQDILDRKSCLLPAYFSVSEICKVYPTPKGWPHWSVGHLLSEFVDGFKPLAQMITMAGRSSLRPVIGHPGASHHVWKVDHSKLTFHLIGSLPYDKDLLEPQNALLRYVIAQPYSRDTVCTMLGLNKQTKQRCAALEELLVDLVIVAMETSEDDAGRADSNNSQMLWNHLSSHLIFFVLFHFASFPLIVLALHKKLLGRGLRKGRDHLMWVLLQFISGSIERYPLSDFFPVRKLFELLYPETEPLPVPDITLPGSVHSFAYACIWIHLSIKAQQTRTERAESFTLPVPYALKEQLEFIKLCSRSDSFSLNDFKIPLLCNAYSTNPQCFTQPMLTLVEKCYGNSKCTVALPGPPTTLAASPTQPCPIALLDSLNVHAKMSLIHNIVSRITKLADDSSPIHLAPALVETYSRLLVYLEIEALGIKYFISQLLPRVFTKKAWGILHTLLEMLSHRVHHIIPHYRVSLLSHLHSLAGFPSTNQNQLHLCVESITLRLITGFASADIQPQLSRLLGEPKKVVSQESEELNRALVLTLARAMHVTGCENINWCEGILKALSQNTPHSWASHTSACFPKQLRKFYAEHGQPGENKQTLRNRVEEEYRKFKEMTNESEILSRFGDPVNSPDLFICIIWRTLLDTGRLTATCQKVLDRLGARKLTSHIRVFADFLVYEFSTSGGGKHVNKCISYLNDMIWKFNIVTLDRLVLCLALRSHEGNEAQVCFFIIQLLLLKPQDFRNRVNSFVKENNPQHWLQSDWHQKHMHYHRSHPERFYFEGLLECTGQPAPPINYLPIYFGNVCLRFLPVFDIIIHRFLELPPVFKSLETLLDHLGSLYKFHDRPVTYMYNTLHYYEDRLRDRPALKKKLVGVIVGAQREYRPANWCLSQGYLDYIRHPDETTWIPDSKYYCSLIGRLVDTIIGDKTPPPFPNCDWRFNEFPNAAAHALHVTCVELMALPVLGDQVGYALFDVLYKSSYSTQPLGIRSNAMSWLNAVGLVMTALPKPYWEIMFDKVCDVIQQDLETRDVAPSSLLLEELTRPCAFPYSFFTFTQNLATHSTTHADYVLAVTHALCHHASIGQLSQFPEFLRERVKPLVVNEAQFLYICCLFGPVLERFHHEWTKCLLEIAPEFYFMLEQVNAKCQQLYHMDLICDFLYHLKYMFVGDKIREDVQRVIPNLRPGLQSRLRFMLVKKDEPAFKPDEAAATSSTTTD